MQISFSGSVQAISVDQHYQLVYWVNFASNKHNLMRSYYTGKTQPLNISYDGEIDLAQDHMHLYVLDKENNRIYKYDKATWNLTDDFTTKDEAKQLIVAFGEFL